jgi:thiol-disulfide isomerase/thioredoxin
MLLVFAYRPAVSKTTATNGDGSTSERSVTRLCRGTKDCCQRGLAELRAATRLAPESVQYQLDYAEGMQICGQGRGSAGLLEALWTRGPQMTGGQKARASRLLAQVARDQNRPQEEARWLCEALNCSPDDEVAAARLEELLAILPPSVFWLNYQAGTQVAKRQNRPMMVSFMAAWCPSCRRLNGEVYANSDVIGLSKKFVCLWVDTDRQPDVARMHAAAKIPTIVFLDPQGRELHRLVGFRQPDVFMSEMRQALGSQG